MTGSITTQKLSGNAVTTYTEYDIANSGVNYADLGTSWSLPDDSSRGWTAQAGHKYGFGLQGGASDGFPLIWTDIQSINVHLEGSFKPSTSALYVFAAGIEVYSDAWYLLEGSIVYATTQSLSARGSFNITKPIPTSYPVLSVTKVRPFIYPGADDAYIKYCIAELRVTRR